MKPKRASLASAALLCAAVLTSCTTVTRVAPAPAPQNAESRADLATGSNLPQPVTESSLLSCEPAADMTPSCGYRNPEDLVQVPGTDLLIVSEMGEFMADSPGGLSLLDLASGGRSVLKISWDAPANSWGEDSCPAPDIAAFSPHGIDLTTRDDGAVALLVVNHGGRESVEFFAVEASGDLAWQGCALPPQDPFINDVAARRDGGFYITHMWDKASSFETIVAMLQSGRPTGWVWAWTPAGGFSKVEGSQALMPNGIALSPDQTTLYVNAYFGNETAAFDLDSGQRLGRIAVRQPDNVSVDTDGRLWIASHQHDPIGQACTQVSAGPCLLPFQIVTADPASFESSIALEHDGAPMGYATVALKVGDSLYLGSAHGDRIVRVDL